jgi:hypothetical protein
MLIVIESIDTIIKKHNILLNFQCILCMGKFVFHAEKQNYKL